MRLQPPWLIVDSGVGEWMGHRKGKRSICRLILQNENPWVSAWAIENEWSFYSEKGEGRRFERDKQQELRDIKNRHIGIVKNHLSVEGYDCQLTFQERIQKREAHLEGSDVSADI